MKNLTVFFLAFFFLAFFNSAQSQQGSQTPVAGLSYAPDSNYVIVSRFYRGRNYAMWMHKDSINLSNGINSGNIFYISENGNNTTGAKGFMELPFTPTVTLDSNVQNAQYWFYPGQYSIGPGKQFNYTLGSTGSRPPYSVYAPNSNVGYFNGTSNGWLYRTDGTELDTVFYATYETVRLTDIGFFRNEDSKTVSLFMKANNFIFKDSIDSGGTVFNMDAGIVQIDSAYSNKKLFYITSGNDKRVHVNINRLEINQSQKTNAQKASMAEIAATGKHTFSLKSNSAYFFDPLTVINIAYAGAGKQNSNIEVSFNNLTVEDNLSAGSISPSTSVNREFPAAGPSRIITYIRDGSTVANYDSAIISFTAKNIVSDKIIHVGDVSTNSTVNINANGRFRKTRAFQYEKQTAAASAQNDNLTLNINLNVTCDTSNAISILTNDTTNTINVTGKMVVNRASYPVIYSVSDIVLENAELYNDGVYPCIEAPSPITVYVRGDLYMNSDSVDPDVTFVKIEYGYQDPTDSQYNDTQTIIDNIAALVAGGSNIYTTDGSLSGNRTVTGGSNNLSFTGMKNLTATGSGTATYRFNLYPSSSLPVLLEQTSAGDTAYLQLRASLGRATLRATQDIYLEAASSVFVSTLEGTSTGIISARPTGELIRREEAFFNAYFISDTITVAASETEINSTFLDAVSPSFTVLGDSIIYTGTDTAYFDIGYYTEAEVLESATGTYLLELSCYKNGVKVFPSESWHRVYFTASETEPIETIAKRFTTQLVTGDVLNIRQNGTTGISAALHNFSFTGQKLQ